MQLCLSAACLAGAALAAETDQADVFVINFEQGSDLRNYPMITFAEGLDAAVVPRPDGKGHCLRLRNTTPSVYCQGTVTTTFEVVRNLVLSFDHRETVEGGEGAYVGIRVTDAEDHPFLEMVPFSEQWKTESIPIGLMTSGRGGVMRPGLGIQSVNVYGRAKGNSRDPNLASRMTVWLDNIKVSQQAMDEPRPSGQRRVSYNNPPMFDWQARPNGEIERLQLSRDPAFPEADTITLELDRAFHVPPEPLAAGPWYYRHWLGNELQHAWSPYSEIVFHDEVHQYIAPVIDHPRLDAMPHPRLRALAMADRDEPDDAERESLVRLAEKLQDQGIPDDPPPMDLSSGRWKSRVDWVQKVATPLTMRTGRALQDVGEAAMLSQSDQAAAAAKEMLLRLTRTWDPEGGSSMHRNDLHSGQLLRGMAWCYDAAWHVLSEDERREVRDNMITRTRMFYDELNPLQGNEAQNHTWNKATTVGVVALALAGEAEKATEWLECVVGLSAYRFLPSMGFQGDNQEGIAYWAYGVGLMIQFTEPVYHVAGVDLYTQPWLGSTGRFPVYCAPPDGYVVPLGDIGGESNHGRRGPIGTGLAGLLGRRSGDPYAMWYGGQAEPSNGVQPRPPVDIAQSIHFRHIDWAIFNTSLVNGLENVMVGMRSGTYFAGHQHADINHVFINAYGDKLAVDGGYYDWYSSPHFKAYSVHSVAHNTILVDGKGQQWREEGGDGDITLFYDSPGYGYTVGDASNPKIYAGALARFDRRLLFVKPGFVVIHDLLEAADGPARFDWLLHAHTAEPFDADSNDGSFIIARPGADLRGKLVAPRDLTLRVERSFDPTLITEKKSVEKRHDPSSVVPEWTLWATPEQTRQREEFVAVMQINRRDVLRYPEATFETVETDNAHAVLIRQGDDLHVILLRKAEQKGVMSSHEVVTDGDAAAVRVSKQGEVLSAFMAGGSRLTFDDKNLCARSATVPAWSSDADAEPSAPLRNRAWLEVDGERRELRGLERTTSHAIERTWWAFLETPTRCRATLDIRGWTGELPPYALLNGKRLGSLRGNDTRFRMQLGAGRHMVTINGVGDLEGVAVSLGQALESVPAVMLPAEYEPGRGSVLIEAETPTVEGEIKGKIWEKAGASGGTANCGWETTGMWAEWEVEVPQDGIWEILVRHCAQSDPVVRDMSIDGRPVGNRGGLFSFAPTGGWSRTSNDWRYFVLADSKGQPFQIQLDQGTHVLRMESVDAPFNTDCFVIRPAP